MAALAPLIIILPLFAFWAWMAHDMMNNPDIPDQAAPGFTWPPVSRTQWILAFVLLNLLAAGYYYFTVYREK